jgi:UPF0755 protein
MKTSNRRRMMIAAIGLVLIVLIGFYATYQLDLRPVTSSSTTAQNFGVTSGERSPQIATNLKAAGLIRSRNSFLTYLNLHGLRSQIKAGSYSLKPNESSSQIASILTSGSNAVNDLVVPEGFRLAQIERLAAEHGISTAAFKAALAEPHSQDFLKTGGKPANVGLEGYLFPDTYAVTPDTTASSLINQMLDTFGKRVGPEYTKAFAAEGLTLHQGLTIASIVEAEVSNLTDRPMVAQVFLKRYKEGISLGSDVTTQYASNLAGVPFDLNLNSPYNTRLNVGIPPGPISNPGLNALDAVAHPAATDYLFFVTGKDGVTYFAKTLAEHNRNIALHGAK